MKKSKKSLSSSEKKLEKSICKYAETFGIINFKFVSISNRGVPDRIFMTPNGYVFFIEFKSINGKCTALQEFQIKKIKKQNVDVFVVNNEEKGIEVIKQVLFVHG